MVRQAERRRARYIFLTVAHNKFKYGNAPVGDPAVEEFYSARVHLDIKGNHREVIDPKGRITGRYDYDVLGSLIREVSMDAGTRLKLNDALGKPLFSWDSRDHAVRSEYDPLRRPLRVFVMGADPTRPTLEVLTERLVYGEQHPDSVARNLRGKLYLHLDQAGVITTERDDFKGNPLSVSRTLTNGTQYRSVVDWSAVDADHVALPTNVTVLLNLAALSATLAPLLEADTYTSSTAYDALNRPVTATAPHTPATPATVIRMGYNEANLLDRVEANLRGAVAGGHPVWTPFATNIDYDSKSQRKRIVYGNNASRFYEYDPLTFRLVHMITRRDAAAFPDDCPAPPPPGWPGCRIQSLYYTYDPIGNITTIRDDAQQAIYFRNKRVEPSSSYIYDALARLIEATGREQLGQVGGPPIPHSYNDAPRVGLLSGDGAGHFGPNDGGAMATYVEQYTYDEVDNFLKMRHSGGNPVRAWARTYTYAETSLIEDGSAGSPLRMNNRLTSTSVGNGIPQIDRYVYDAHGNTIRMPHMGGTYPAPNMFWDYRDQLMQANLGGGGTAYYVFDSAGQRVRKVWEKFPGLVEERIYLGGLEIYRRRQGAQRLKRETLHVMDDQQRIAVVETRTLDTAGTDPAPAQLIRYQLGNHLASVSIELDDNAQIISYEEYTPYGSTAYQGVRSQLETPNRYRYTGKERDEETGFYYHGARSVAPWLGRWVSCDPSGIADSLSVYVYVKCNPVTSFDPKGKDRRTWINRGIGLLQVVGGGIEIAAGAAGIAAPTGVTQVLGVIAVVHGADTASTGLMTLWTGEVQKTLTEQAVTGTAKAVGASEDTAHKIGVGADLVVGIVPSAGVGLARAAATKAAVEGGTEALAHAAPAAAADAAPAAATHAAPAAATHAAPAAATHAAPAAAAAARSSSKLLARTLQAAGHVRPPKSAAHHIVAGTAKAAASARAVLTKFGIGINDAVNGVFLPANRAAAAGGSAIAHSATHTNAYYNAVNVLLGQATTRQEAIEALKYISSKLLTGGLP